MNSAKRLRKTNLRELHKRFKKHLSHKQSPKYNFIEGCMKLLAIIAVILSLILMKDFFWGEDDSDLEIVVPEPPMPIIIEEVVEPEPEIEETFFISPEKDGQLLLSIVSIYAGDNLGTGFVVGEMGYILTNYDLVDRAKWIEVDLYDGRIAQARIKQRDKDQNIALIKMNGVRFNPLSLGNSSNLIEGQAVAAIGHPLGYGVSMIPAKVGRINSINRTFELIIQDSRFNDGCLGGPVIDLDGRVAGMIMQSNEGENPYAVNSDELKAILDGIV